MMENVFKLVIPTFLDILGTPHVSADNFYSKPILNLFHDSGLCIDVLLIASTLGVIPALGAHSQVTLTS